MTAIESSNRTTIPNDPRCCRNDHQAAILLGKADQPQQLLSKQQLNRQASVFPIGRRGPMCMGAHLYGAPFLCGQKPPRRGSGRAALGPPNGGFHAAAFREECAPLGDVRMTAICMHTNTFIYIYIHLRI